MWLRRELICLREKLGTGTLLLEGQEWAVDEGMVVGYDGMICGIGALGSKIMVGIARAVDAGNIAEAIRLQNVLISLFHEIYGCDLANVWTGQKYALMKLGLIESSRTLAVLHHRAGGIVDIVGDDDARLDTRGPGRRRGYAYSCRLFRADTSGQPGNSCRR